MEGQRVGVKGYNTIQILLSPPYGGFSKTMKTKKMMGQEMGEKRAGSWIPKV